MGYRMDVMTPRLTRLPDMIAPDALAVLPAGAAMALQALPLDLQDDRLEVALAGPIDWERLQHLRLLSGRRVQARMIDPGLLEQGLRQWYPEMNSEDAAMDASPVSNQAQPGDVPEETNAAPVVQLVDRIITTAVQRMASDIHIEPFEQTLQLRYRIDGYLQAQPPLPWTLRAAIVSRIKVLATLDIAEKRRPQDGKIRLHIQGRDIDFRVSTTPTIYGEKVVLRILDREAVALDLTQLGLSHEVLTPLQQVIARPYGLALVTGPTGSGKTTTLYAALNHIQAEGINILTVEDPIEYNLPGVNQTQVHAEIGLSFAHALRSFLRQDPNVILVGEIRDSETASIAIQSALTGHLVLSSVHTNDASGAVSRLLDMGIEPFLVASSLSLVLAQRLVRRNCAFCKQPIELTAEQQEQLGVTESIPTWQGTGCSRCYDTGYRGRIAIAEVMPVSPAISELITQRASARDIRRQAMQEGMRPMHDDGIRKLKDGLTSPYEVIRETVAA